MEGEIIRKGNGKDRIPIHLPKLEMVSLEVKGIQMLRLLEEILLNNLTNLIIVSPNIYILIHCIPPAKESESRNQSGPYIERTVRDNR